MFLSDTWWYFIFFHSFGKLNVYETLNRIINVRYNSNIVSCLAVKPYFQGNI